MPSSTASSVQSNETFVTGVVPLATGVLNTFSWGTGVGMNYAEITTVVAGSPASFTILLEGSVDGSTWVTLATLNNTAGETQFSSGLIQFTSLRVRCTAVAGGTNPTVDCVVTCSQEPFQSIGGGTTVANRVTVIGSVDTTQVVNRYQSLSATGTTTAAPAAGTSIASVNVADFYYQVDVQVGFGATAESTAVDNFVLKAGATTLYTLPVSNTANSQARPLTFYVNPGGVTTLSINVGTSAGSAGSLYKATIIATRLV